TGRASLEALDRKASRVVAVDQTRAKLSTSAEDRIAFSEAASATQRYNHMMFYESDVKQFLYNIKDGQDMKFDCIFCQQAINYWLKKDSRVKETCAELVKNALTGRGKFVFNTFNKKPSEDIVVKEYEFDGLHYAEVSQLVDGVVHHGQFCQGLQPDHQEFDWISSEEFMMLLRPYFKTITINSDGPTDIYVCS
ncbi:MAG: class I SAM-dependent methyltransferase, partial [Candidatus Scalindua sp.]|nr:class I SAM-dependent methyltransferase [Candidatus Scalindua sp.]